MNETSTPSAITSRPYEEFVWRRLEQPLELWLALAVSIGLLLLVLVGYTWWMYTHRREMDVFRVFSRLWKVGAYFLASLFATVAVAGATRSAWPVLLIGVLTVALFYVIAMYIKDSVAVGFGWASLLGFLRTCVYVVLTLVFLLPAQQTYIETRTESKVIVAFDISDSVQSSDQIPSGAANEVLPTRMDRVMRFLRDDKITFIPGLEKKNPVALYRLGSRLDDDYLFLTGGKALTRAEKETPPRDAEGNLVPAKPQPLQENYWRAWLSPARFSAPAPAVPRAGDLLEADRDAVRELREAFPGSEKEPRPKSADERKLSVEEQRWLVEKREQVFVDQVRALGIDLGNDMERERFRTLWEKNRQAVRNLTTGTNLGDSLQGIIGKEQNNRLQGIVLFTDGRNTEGSAGAFRELDQRARAARIPLFVVGVGEDRQKVRLEIVDVRAPQQVQPEDKFRLKTEITGEGLPGEKLDVNLEITHTRLARGKTKDKSGKIVDVEKEEKLPLTLVEQENPDDPKKPEDRIKIPLGDVLKLPSPGPVTLDKGAPPRAEVEWQIDAAALAAAARIDLTDAKYAGKKWELGETQEDSEIKFVVRVPTDKREGLRVPMHESSKIGMKVTKKPLRVLLLASSGGREYQFVRTLMIREMDRKRLEVAVCLQLPPGEQARRTGVVQDVPPDRLLSYFPDTFRKKKDLYDLSSYDVIVMFDPDWRQLDVEQIKNLRDWAEKGGGLVVMGGHINTVELVRFREGEDADRYRPILELLPVILDDMRLETIERRTDEPFALSFSEANPEMEFLKLDDQLVDPSKFLEDWQVFFWGDDKVRPEKPERGFFSFYPVKEAKKGSVVVARFTDPQAKLKDGTLHPYMVLKPKSEPRVVWMGSNETWRLRDFREEYHERFWTKLVRYAAERSKGPVVRPIRLEAPSILSAQRYMEVEAKIEGPDGNPLDRNIKPLISLKMPPGVPDTEIRQPIVMAPRPGARDGWFSGRFLVKSPGDYELTVKVPRQPGQESDQAETMRFTVKAVNPELDNTRPDFDRMYRLASEADEVLLRMSEADRNEVKRRLVRPKLASAPDAADQTEIREDRVRLYFDLNNAQLIPTCMVPDVQLQKSRGRHRDLWDDGFTLYSYPEAEPGKPQREPIKIAYVLLIVVGLLSTEWLIRKLLRLA